MGETIRARAGAGVLDRLSESGRVRVHREMFALSSHPAGARPLLRAAFGVEEQQRTVVGGRATPAAG